MSVRKKDKVSLIQNIEEHNGEVNCRPQEMHNSKPEIKVIKPILHKSRDGGTSSATCTEVSVDTPNSLNVDNSMNNIQDRQHVPDDASFVSKLMLRRLESNSGLPNARSSLSDTLGTSTREDGTSSLDGTRNSLEEGESNVQDGVSSPADSNNSSATLTLSSNEIWQMNYHEAAIFLQEGEDNDKFDSHPTQRKALPAYLLTHSKWFYGLDLLASLVLLSLSVVERPAIDIFKGMNEGVHATVELFTLFVLGISIIMQLKWLGWQKFFKHKRSMLKIAAWTIMVAEAITVIVRNTSHFRVTRALRPIFLLDNRHLGGVRRFLRQLLQSVPPILEVIVILLLVLGVFSTLGFYLFSAHQEDPYFTTMPQSFVSLFVLMTTANFPDVMMPSYARNRWSAAFFILFLAITLYCIMNFMMAIVFVVFSAIEKEKFRKLLLHKRKACELSFRLLVSRNSPDAITFANFTGLLKYYKPKANARDVFLTFKALNKTRTGSLSLNEFYQFYTACGLSWQPTEPQPPWYSHLPSPGPKIGAGLRKMVSSPVWEAFVYVIICCNAITLLVHTLLLSSSGGVAVHPHVTWDQMAYIAFYTAEILLKMIGLGLTEYIRSGWNIFDLLVTGLSIAGIVAEEFGHPFFFIVILRPLRLLRLFRLRRRYREVFETLTLLAPRVFSASIVIIIIYYSFAIIGMEMFSQYHLMNCCVNSTVEQFYHYDNNSLYQNYYYLNNFDNIFMAGVTLFELTVVNNWFIIMEGYAYVSGDWSRLFFMFFYLVMMIVMSVVLAFILEAFTFRMQYNQTVNKNRKKPRSEVTKVIVPLTEQEIDLVYSDSKDTSTVMQYAHDKSRAGENNGIAYYLGRGERSKGALQLRMYRHLLHQWYKDDTPPPQTETSANTRANARAGQVRAESSERELSAQRDLLLREAEMDTPEESVRRRPSTTRVTMGGVTEVVEEGEGDTWRVRKRGSSIASNLMEWWKAEMEELSEEEEAHDPLDESSLQRPEDSEVFWGSGEAEITAPPVTVIQNPFEEPHSFEELSSQRSQLSMSASVPSNLTRSSECR